MLSYFIIRNGYLYLHRIGLGMKQKACFSYSSSIITYRSLFFNHIAVEASLLHIVHTYQLNEGVTQNNKTANDQNRWLNNVFKWSGLLKVRFQ